MKADDQPKGINSEIANTMHVALRAKNYAIQSVSNITLSIGYTKTWTEEC
jgi:hypothetical protein